MSSAVMPRVPSKAARLRLHASRTRCAALLPIALLLLQASGGSANEPPASSPEVASVLGPRPARSAGRDRELEDLDRRLTSLVQHARERSAGVQTPDPSELEPARTRGVQAIASARAALARGDRAAVSRHKQVGWAAVAVLARVIARAEAEAALRAGEARAHAAERELAQADESLRELRARVAALRARVQGAREAAP